MLERSEVAQVRERFAGGDGDEARELSPRRWPRVLGAFAALFVAAVAGGVLLTSCGGQRESATGTESSAAVATPETGGQAQLAAAGAAPATAQAGLSAEDVATREGLPPDLSVSVPDTLVVPGEVVEFTVLGTTDVSEVALSDGRDELLPFVRDSGADTWRVQYRVPLHPRSDRFGVSVTAKNELNRWRRVWVFLHVERGDSTASDQAPVDNPDQLVDEK